jgi:lantibiotic transport system permease protein
MSLAISLRSETLKLKRTLGIYLCVIAAAFGPLMSFLEYFDMGPNPTKGLPWTVHFMQGREPLAFVMLPLYVVLICTLLLQIEYRDKTWKQVLSSPQSMLNIFFAKFFSFQIMILGFLIAYHLFFVVTAIFTELMLPDLYEGNIDVAAVLRLNARLYILVLGMSSIQFWLSLRFRNFMVSLAIGISLWFLAPMLLFVFKWNVDLYPYAFTILSALKKYEANVVTYQWYSIITTVLFLTLAFVEFRVRKVKM